MFALRFTNQRVGAVLTTPGKAARRKVPTQFCKGQRRAASKWGSQRPKPKYRTFEEPKSGGGPKQNEGPRPDDGPQYSPFARFNGLRELWLASPPFRFGTGAVGVGGVYFYVSNLETVPVTGRRRFNIYSPESVQSMTKNMYESELRALQGKILPPWHPNSKAAQRVLDRLIPHSGIHHADWQIHVVDDNSEKNAYVMPGGKVFVFSGLLPICKDEDGLATILGHEIAHHVANHVGERMSASILVTAAVWGASLLLGLDPSWAGTLFEYGFSKPGSRRQESEADYVGLLMMAESCYNPEGALELWKRMEQAGGAGVTIPQILSTHPSDRNRIARMRQWLPEAQMKWETSECGDMARYADNFRDIVRIPKMDVW